MSTDYHGERRVRLAVIYDDCFKRLRSAIYEERSEEHGLRITAIFDKLELWEKEIGLRHNGRNLLDQVDDAGSLYTQQNHIGGITAESELYIQTHEILNGLEQAIKGSENSRLER
jgi:hypothetical protein